MMLYDVIIWRRALHLAACVMQSVYITKRYKCFYVKSNIINIENYELTKELLLAKSCIDSWTDQ